MDQDGIGSAYYLLERAGKQLGHAAISLDDSSAGVNYDYSCGGGVEDGSQSQFALSQSFFLMLSVCHISD